MYLIYNKMRRNTIVRIFIVIGIIVGLLIVLNKYKKSDSDSAVQIGLIVDLTGSMSMYGEWVKKGSEIAVDELGTGEVYLLMEDSKSDAKVAANAIEKLISLNKTQLIISGSGSSCIMSMAPIAEKNKTLLFSTLASSPNITTAGEYIFRNRISGIFEAESMAKKASSLNFKKMAVIATNNDAGVPYIDAFKNEFKKLSGNDAYGLLIDPNTTNLKAQALQLKNYNPDAIFVVMPIIQVLNLIKETRALDFKTQWLGISSLKADEFLMNGGQYTEGFIIANEGIDYANPKYIEFSGKYKAKFQEDPTIYAVNGYDAVKILVYLYKKDNGNIDSIRQSLYDKNGFETASGHISFDGNGDVIKNIELLRISNGQFEQISD